MKTLAERRIVGTPTRRIDGPDIVRGAALYGIDLQMSGMKSACLARPPRLGATVKSFDAKPARAVPGVVAVTQVSQGVAVVADSTWAALRGVEALEVDWSDGPGSSFSTARAWADLENGVATKGVETRRDGDPEAALAAAARKHRGDLPLPHLRARRDGAAELHRRRARRQGAAHGRHAEPAACPGGGGGDVEGAARERGRFGKP